MPRNLILDPFKKLKGHLKIERFTKDGLLDTPVDSANMIMAPGRISMAEIFANLTECKFAHRFMFGTLGHRESVWDPKQASDGFTMIRDRMFSQPSFVTYGNGEVLETLNRNDIIKVAYDGGATKMWRYLSDDKTNYVLKISELQDSGLFELVEKEPYTVSVDFELPRTNTPAPDFSTTPISSPYNVKVTQQDTTVTFVIEIPMDAANDQYVDNDDYSIPTTVFTEASLWVNDRIFSMKTFQGVTKDNSIKLRVTWNIMF